MAFCDNCGSALADDANFCAKCGRARATEAAAGAASDVGTSHTAAEPQGPAATASEQHAPPPSLTTQPKKQNRRWKRYFFTLGLWGAVPLTRRLWRGGHRIAAVAVGGGAALVLLIIVIAAASGGSKSPSSPTSTRAEGATSAPTASAPAANVAAEKPQMSSDQKHALGWIKDHGFDADRVQANVENVQLAVGIAIKQGTQANINQLASTAQTAHDNLDNIRADFATTDLSGTLGNAELEAFSGANDLKNAMGALVAYTGDPTPATLAHFNSQYGQAAAEWNQGVRTIWRLAHRKKPPTV